MPADTHTAGPTFDPDDAGQKAASRAFAEEQRFAAQTFVAVAPDGLDPCDLRLNKGDEAVRALVKTRRPMFEFMIRRHLDAHNLETVEGRVAALRERLVATREQLEQRAVRVLELEPPRLGIREVEHADAHRGERHRREAG